LTVKIFFQICWKFIQLACPGIIFDARPLIKTNRHNLLKSLELSGWNLFTSFNVITRIEVLFLTGVNMRDEKISLVIYSFLLLSIFIFSMSA